MTVKEQYKLHVQEMIRMYIQNVNYEIESFDVLDLDAVIGSAMLTGMDLMNNWQLELSHVKFSPKQVSEANDELIGEYGYRSEELGS